MLRGKLVKFFGGWYSPDLDVFHLGVKGKVLRFRMEVQMKVNAYIILILSLVVGLLAISGCKAGSEVTPSPEAGSSKTPTGTLEVHPELQGLLTVDHDAGWIFEELEVEGRIRNVSNEEISIRVEVEFYDSEGVLLEKEYGRLDKNPSKTLEPEDHCKLWAPYPGYDPKKVVSYKIIIEEK